MYVKRLVIIYVVEYYKEVVEGVCLYEYIVCCNMYIMVVYKCVCMCF